MWFLNRKTINVDGIKVVIKWKAGHKDKRPFILKKVREWIGKDKRIRKFRRITIFVEYGEGYNKYGEFKDGIVKNVMWDANIFLYLAPILKENYDPLITLTHELFHNVQYINHEYNSFKRFSKMDEQLKRSESDMMEDVNNLMNVINGSLALIDREIDVTSDKALYDNRMRMKRHAIKLDRERDNMLVDSVIGMLNYFILKLAIEGQAEFCGREYDLDDDALVETYNSCKPILSRKTNELREGLEFMKEFAQVRLEVLAGTLKDIALAKAPIENKLEALQTEVKSAFKEYDSAKKQITKSVRVTRKIFRVIAYDVGAHMTHAILCTFDIPLEKLAKKDVFKFVKMYERACKKHKLSPLLVSLGDSDAIYCHRKMLKSWRGMLKRKKRTVRVAKK